MTAASVKSIGPLRTTMHLARRFLIGGAILALGALAIVTPIAAPGIAPIVLGVLMIAAAALQALYALGLRRSGDDAAARVASAVSLIAGILLVAWGRVRLLRLAALLGLSWIIDGGVKVFTAVREPDVAERRTC